MLTALQIANGVRIGDEGAQALAAVLSQTSIILSISEQIESVMQALKRH